MLSSMYYAIKHTFQRNWDICPRCGITAFQHGFAPYNEYYCTKCHLWEPNWEERNKWIDNLKKEGKIKNDI